MTTDKKHPQHVKDKEKTAEKLATVINLDKSEILDILNRDGAKQVEFGYRDISYAKNKRSKNESSGYFFLKRYEALLSERCIFVKCSRLCRCE